MDDIIGKSKGFLEEFRTFAIQGNMIDLAVAVVIGAAFNSVINSLVNNVIMQAVAWCFGKPNFNSIVIGPIQIGDFITALVNFLIIALSVFLTLKILMRWLPKKPIPESGEYIPKKKS